jgi:hypothetical protein
MSVKIKATDMDRKEITTTLGEEYEGFGGRKTFLEETMDWDGCTLDEMIAKIETIRETYSDTFKNIKLDKDYEYDYDNEQRTVWKFVGNRMETDAEYNARIEMIKQREADRIEHDRAEYVRLKAQFGE